MIHPIVKFLYSDSYSQVGVYASWLAIGYCVHGVGDMLNRYLGSHGEGKFIKMLVLFVVRLRFLDLVSWCIYGI